MSTCKLLYVSAADSLTKTTTTVSAELLSSQLYELGVKYGKQSWRNAGAIMLRGTRSGQGICGSREPVSLVTVTS